MTQGHRPEIERALRFINANLEHPISVAEVARAAHLSEFHLHRVFHAEVGESIGRFVTRLRLELSALNLAYQPDRSITDIALASGYSSSSNFSKAFAGYFGCSPSQVRNPTQGLPASVGKITLLHGAQFTPEALYAVPPERDSAERKLAAASWEARVRYETSHGQTFSCLASPAGYDLGVLEGVWQELIERVRQLGLADEAIDAWGIAQDSPQITAPELCRYHACVPCPANVTLQQPLFRSEMQPGRYAVFRFEGAVTEIAAAYRSIYSCWFRESSLAPADFVPLDRYVAGPPQNGRVEMEMWFRVRPRR